MQNLKPALAIDDNKAFDPSIYAERVKSVKNADERVRLWQPILYQMPEFISLSDEGKKNAIETLKNNPDKFLEIVKKTPYYQNLSDEGKKNLEKSLYNPKPFMEKLANAPTVAEKHGLKYEGDSASPDVYIDPTGWAGGGAVLGLKALPGIIAGDLVGEGTKILTNKLKGQEAYQGEGSFMTDWLLPMVADVLSGYAGVKIYDRLNDEKIVKLFNKLLSKGEIENAKKLIKKVVKKLGSDIDDKDIDEFVNKANEILKKPKEEVKQEVITRTEKEPEIKEKINVDEVVKRLDELKPKEDKQELLIKNNTKRIIPENISPEELPDVRNYALKKGQEGINEYLEVLKPETKQTNKIEVVQETKTPEDLLNLKQQVRQGLERPEIQAKTSAKEMPHNVKWKERREVRKALINKEYDNLLELFKKSEELPRYAYSIGEYWHKIPDELKDKLKPAKDFFDFTVKKDKGFQDITADDWKAFKETQKVSEVKNEPVKTRYYKKPEIDKVIDDYINLQKKLDSLGKEKRKEFINKLKEKLPFNSGYSGDYLFAYIVKTKYPDLSENSINYWKKYINDRVVKEYRKRGLLNIPDIGVKSIKEHKEIGLKEPEFQDIKDIELFSGIPTSHLFKSLADVDNVVYKNITSKIEDTKFDKFLRKYLLADKYGFGSISRKKEDKVINDYLKLKSHLARGDISAEKKEKILSKYLDRLEEGKRKILERLMIQYLENPDIRKRVKAEIPEIANDLDKIRREIDRLGKLKMEKGMITPSQYNKWKDKYLTRLYVMDDDVEGLDITRGIKQYEEKKGRKIDSIVDFIEYLKKEDPIKAEEWEKKAILDPIKAVKATLAKSYANLAIDEFYRKMINDPELVPQKYLVELPIEVGKLPKKMSPYYAENKVLPYLRDILKKTNDDGIRQAIRDLRKQIKEKKELIERDLNALDKNGYRQISEKTKARFGVISGVPVHKDIANLIEGMTRVIENPMDTASKADKWLSSAIAYFKWAKVPANIFAYPRNLMSNWIQFAMSGADPTNFPVYFGKAVKNFVFKDRYYELGRKWGLFHSNLASEEINKIFGELSQTVKPDTKPKQAFKLFLKGMQKVGNAYGAIDDLAKLARFRYAIEVEKKPIKEAVRIAQDTHFDYGLTYNVIRAMRDPNVDRGVFLKLFGTLFPTYTHKALSFLYDTTIKRPITLTTLLGGFYALKQYIEYRNERKVGKRKYEEIKKLIPEFLDSPFVIPLVDEKGEWITFVDPSYIVPFGNLVNMANDLIQGQPGDALRELGALSNPIYTAKAVHENRDPLTGKHIYYPYNTFEKYKNIGEYLLDQWFMPLTIVKIKQLRESKHPVKERILTGMLWYRYPEGMLKRFKVSDIQRAKLETQEWITKIKKDMAYWDKAYRDGEITKDEWEQKKKELGEELRKYYKMLNEYIKEKVKEMKGD
ncbi:hypothetical protein [Persephonella sp.]